MISHPDFQPAVQLALGHELNPFQAGFIRMLHPIMTMTETGRRLYFICPRVISWQSPSCPISCSSWSRTGERVSIRGTLPVSAIGAIYCSPGLPPSFGGPLIALSLSLLEKLKPLDRWGSPEHLLRILAMMQEVEKMRENGSFNSEALAEFLASSTRTTSVENMRMFSRGTTHVSIADSEGNIASLTCSNGEGSGYFVPGTGIMLNNMMGEDDLHLNGFHFAPPGERVGSMMSPSALLRDSELKLVFGSGGSKRIRPALTQVLTQLVDFNRDLGAAVHAPRMHWDGEVLQLEPGFEEQAVAALADRVPINIWDDQNVYFGGVHSVIPGFAGVGDPRRGGSVAVVEL